MNDSEKSILKTVISTLNRLKKKVDCPYEILEVIEQLEALYHGIKKDSSDE